MTDRRPAERLDPAVVAAVRTLLAPIGQVQDITALTGGFFATSYRADLADGTLLVVKTAPATTDRLLTYEKDLIRAEALTYRTAEAYPDLLMPHVVLTDFSRSLLPGDVVVATWAPGVPVDQAGEVADRTRAARDRRLGRLMADLHRLHGDRYGYLDPETRLRGDTWADAFTAMVDQILADGARWGVDLPADRIRDALRRHRATLDTVRHPHLLHGDLWPGNLFIDPGTGDLTGVIDPERGFWGDPAFDLVAAEWERVGDPGPDLVAGYLAADGAVDPCSEVGRRRVAFCRVYLGLQMLVEVHPRGYDWDGLDEHLGTLRERLAANLALLD